MSWISGLDLGQSGDFTALACLEKITRDGDKPLYKLRHLQRFPLGTPYPEMMREVRDIFSAEWPRPGMHNPLTSTPLCVDYTGVGRPVMDIIREVRIPARLMPILITGGHKVTFEKEDRSWHVPKKELVSVMQVLLQSGRLIISKGLKEATKLEKELQNFKVKITVAMNEQFGNWRENQHDDLVLAVALAAWFGEQTGNGDVKKIRTSPRERSLLGRAPEGVFDK